jgi:hypothetical protein
MAPLKSQFRYAERLEAVPTLSRIGIYDINFSSLVPMRIMHLFSMLGTMPVAAELHGGKSRR